MIPLMLSARERLWKTSLTRLSPEMVNGKRSSGSVSQTKLTQIRAYTTEIFQIQLAPQGTDPSQSAGRTHGELKGNGQATRGFPNQPQPPSKQWLAGCIPQQGVPQPPPRVTSHSHLADQIPGRGGGAEGWHVTEQCTEYRAELAACNLWSKDVWLEGLKGRRPCLGQLKRQYSVYCENYVVRPRGFAISGQGLRRPVMTEKSTIGSGLVLLGL